MAIKKDKSIKRGSKFDNYPNHSIILFDSTCLLCNKAVQLILKIDKKQIFKMAALSGNFGGQFQQEHNIKVDSIVLCHNNRYSIKSSAILEICRLLGLPYSIMSVFYVVPTIVRDWVYDIIAHNRKKWFGTANSCAITSQNFGERVLP